MSSSVEEIKERLGIEEVVSDYVKLYRAGRNLKAKCPFHNERTPSFMVSPERGTYHCFGCSVGGDIFSFVEAIEGVDFKGALKILADKAGVEIKYSRKDKKETNDKEMLLKVTEEATGFFEKNFDKNKEASSYMKKRGIKSRLIKNFRIGFANDSWEDLLTHLKNKGFNEEHIERAGLIIKSDKGKGYYDRFRSRIMFPIADSAGRVIAFSGRAFGRQAENKSVAKYINSPETRLYNKSKILYGYDKAKQSIRKNNFAILVEGQMDLLASHQSGFANTVAISGTALTDSHISLLSRMSKNLVLALDSDDAGLSSTEKSARSALLKGFDVKVAQMPENTDPADIILRDNGETEYKKIIKNSKHVIEFILGIYKKKSQNDSRKFKRYVERKVIPFLNYIKSPMDKEHFIDKIALYTGVKSDTVRESLQILPDEKHSILNNANKPNTSKADKRMNFAERLVGICIWKKDKNLENELKRILEKKDFDKIADKLNKDNSLLFNLEETYKDDKQIKDDTDTFLKQLERMIIREKILQISLKIRDFEESGNEDLINKYTIEHKRLNERLSEIS